MADGISKENKKIKSFLMIGQSNMAGRGDFGQVPEIQNENCYMLRMGRWQPMSEPINVDRDILHIRYHSGVSLAASFADEVAKHFGVEVGLIPCADGGTKICQWQPNEVLYDHAVAMTKLALRNSELAGIIWHQGESDCRDFDKEQYRKMFLHFVTSLRKELQAEHLPFIMGEISDKITSEKPPFLEGVKQLNQLLRELKEQIPHCELVSVEDLTLKEDGLHFDSASYRILGKRYFEKYKKLAEGC